MMAVSIRDGLTDRPVMLFEKRLLEFDVAPDGRFLAVLPDETAPPAPVHVVLNWTLVRGSEASRAHELIAGR